MMGWGADPKITGGGLLIGGLVHPIYLSLVPGRNRGVSTMMGKTNDRAEAEDVVSLTLKAKQGYGLSTGT